MAFKDYPDPSPLPLLPPDPPRERNWEHIFIGFCLGVIAYGIVNASIVFFGG
jgi:energy-converting hydrogenase Eha subunit A